MTKKKMHPLLRRQIKECFGDAPEAPGQWSVFLDQVNRTYHQLDNEKNLLARSLEGSARERQQAHSDMKAILETFPAGEDQTLFIIRNMTDLQDAKSALKKSEEIFTRLVNAIPDIVVHADLDGKINFVNDYTLRISGYSRNEIEGRNLIDFVSPKDHEHVIQNSFHMLEHRLGPDEFRMIAKDGRELPFEINGDVLRGEDGAPFGVVHVCRDITDRRQAEKALTESERKYRLLAEKMTDIVWVTDMDLRAVYISPSIQTILGFSREDRIHQTIYEQFTPASAAAAFEYFAGELEIEKEGRADPNRTLTLMVECYHRDGSTRWMETTMSWLRDDEGALAGIHGVSRDVTERKRAQDALRAAHAELENRVAERTSELTVTNAHLKELLLKQDINIDLAKNILSMINCRPNRHHLLAEGINLFFTARYLPCNAEGGDHFFMTNFSERQPAFGKTAISLKDQSGHEVGCILRSIMTDIIHNALLAGAPDAPLETIITELNKAVCNLPFFGQENFFTAVNAEIHHDTLRMRYLSAGHPPFLLIRNRDVFCLPDLDDGGRNLPIGVHPAADFGAKDIQLQPGDKLLFFTDGLTDMPYASGRPVLNAADVGAIVAGLLREDPQLPISPLMDELLCRIRFRASGNTPLPESDEDDITLLGVELESAAFEYEDTIHPADAEEFHACVQRLFQTISAEWLERKFATPEIRLRTVLEEALVNAWIHGNREDPRKKIIIRRRYGNDAVLEILDEGDGFDYTALYDPTRKENVFEPRGRGNFIMRLYAEETRWTDRGRRLTAYFSKADGGELRVRPMPGFNLWQRLNTA